MIAGLEQLYRPPRLGVIRLGIKVPNRDGAGEHPQEVPYFVLPQDLVGVFGERPTRLVDIRLPFNDPAKNLHSIFYEKRAGRLLTIRCDGVECVEIPVDGHERVIECRKDPKDLWKACECGARARAKLSIVVPQTRAGLWEVPIGGLRRIADLMSELQLYALKFGRLTGIPFDLARVGTEENYRKQDGMRAARTGYPVHLSCPVTDSQAALIAGADVVIPAARPPADEGRTWGVDVGAGARTAVREVGEPAAESVGAVDHAEGDELPDEDEGVDWDISVAFKAAAAVGVSATMYERYLFNQYGARSGDLKDEDVRKERARLEKPGDGLAVKRLVAEMAIVASGGKKGA